MVHQVRRTTRLACAVCGCYTQGRQWHNQDRDYGICPECAKWLEEKYGKAYVEDCYGKEGVHWGIQQEQENTQSQDSGQ